MDLKKVFPNDDEPQMAEQVERPRGKRKRRKIRHAKLGGVTLSDWQSIEDDREKYQAYLCSREWAELKTAVHERAGGICERCAQFPIDAVHHLTYARKYAETLDDLAGWCKHCHNFTHDKHWFDPNDHRRIIAYMIRCSKEQRDACPFEAFDCPDSLCQQLTAVLSLIEHAHSLMDVVNCHESDILEQSIIAMDSVLPFVYYGRPVFDYNRIGPVSFFWIAGLFGLNDGHAMDEWRRPTEDDE